ncbi:tRNA (guanosine(37)-N1)-methyltransferase TrmD [Candidatus Nomurabacteria bacterium GWB1_40_6]|uniref:tRNA (guanine-N(1)-)-methyltransferase n=1 Tax=Candidatus Nomurabacteria bacterium GWB1_40_6 TaxID=1801727 RepID=A0A1F6TMV9_9BACT|nr:MAG: tRNA (guanosine(37)-N1)-methyltransferase TrmD [Candidatus Nomurabacteria bacterium GWB1_40_6]
MRFHIITIFPEMFDSYLKESILGRAIKEKKISIKFYNPRDFIKPARRGGATKKDNGYRPVDDKPYGGGPGMVMRAEPILKAVEFALKKISTPSRKRATPQEGNKKTLTINFIPSAPKFTTSFAKTFSKKYTDIILICGRYEGIDARIDKILKTKKFSIGDYVLTGGELPAMVLIDSISRQIPGVLGKYESLEEERVSSSEVYTRPEVLRHKGKNYKVPKVLLSGNHKKIEEWRKGSKNLTKKSK